MMHLILPPNNNGKGGLYLGNEIAAQDSQTLKKNNIRAVVTIIAEEFQEYDEEVVDQHLKIFAYDIETENIKRFFHKSFTFIEENL